MNRLADVDLRLLRVFAAVVEAGGYSPAQSLLNIGSSTISLHMSDLEQRLGFRLCTRGRRGFALTDRGRITYQEVRRILATLDDFTSTMASLKKRLSGKLRIGLMDSMITSPDMPIVRAISRFNELDNDVYIELIVAARPELERDIISGNIHAAISPFVKKISGLNHHILYDEVHRLYCGRRHPLFARPDAEPAEIRRHGFVLRTQQEAWDKSHVGAVKWAAQANGMDSIAMLILSGGYVGFLADHYARHWVDTGEMRAIGGDDFIHVSRHALVTSSSRRMPAALYTLFSILTDDVQAHLNHALEE